jgi:hypothetical protein
MWKVINTANDRSKTHLHRLASKFNYEPSIGGVRLRLGASMELDDEHFESVRAQLEGWKGKGIVDFERIGGETPKEPDRVRGIPADAVVIDVQSISGPSLPLNVKYDEKTGKVLPITEPASEAPSESPEEAHPKKNQGKKKLF